MKIAFCRVQQICEPGIINAFRKNGHEPCVFSHTYTSLEYDTDYIRTLAAFIQSTPDISCVFSVNFIPMIARVCKLLKLPYLSWTADCPSFQLYSKTIAYPCNHLFFFDRIQAEQFSSVHPGHVHHLPLGCDAAYLDALSVTKDDHAQYDCDVSFIGSLYTDCRYNAVEAKLPDYIRGYVSGLVSAQQNVYGYNFLKDSITAEWADEFKKHADWTIAEDYTEDIPAITADIYIGGKCTEQERINTLRAISRNFNTDLYTFSDSSMLPDIHNRGIAESGTMMPKIFKCSKINLNITSRPIQSGLPLRIFDIMGAGGFLISNYQPEIPEHFVPDEDIVLYGSIPELLSKIEYYLNHDEERAQIAKNGYEKVKKYHTYEMRVARMLQMSGLV